MRSPIKPPRLSSFRRRVEPGGDKAPVFEGGAPVEIPPDSTSGNDSYSLVFVTDDVTYHAPVDSDGEPIGVGYQT